MQDEPMSHHCDPDFLHSSLQLPLPSPDDSYLSTICLVG